MNCTHCKKEMTLMREIDEMNTTDPHMFEIWWCNKCRERRIKRNYLYDVGHFFKIIDDRIARLKSYRHPKGRPCCAASPTPPPPS